MARARSRDSLRPSSRMDSPVVAIRAAGGKAGRLVRREGRTPSRALAQPEAQRDRACDLDAGAAHFPLALREVEVAHGEEGAGNVDGQQEPAARHELRHVQVAAELPGRDRPQAEGGLGRDGGLREIIRHRAATRAELLLARADARDRLVRGSEPGDAGEGRLGHGDAGQLRRTCAPPVDLPLHQVGRGKEVGKVAEPGDDRGDPEARRLVGDEVDLEHVARLRSVDVDGARERVSQAEVDDADVLVRASRPELAGEAVLGLERELLAGRDAGNGLQLWVPAVVHPHASSSTRTRSAASCARARSSWLHVRGAPS